MTHYIISYDISHDRLRTKVAKQLQAAGCYRLQYSVFLAPRFRLPEIRQLRQTLHQLLQVPERQDTDSILCWSVSAGQLPTVVWEGDAEAFAERFRAVRLRFL